MVRVSRISWGLAGLLFAASPAAANHWGHRGGWGRGGYGSPSYGQPVPIGAYAEFKLGGYAPNAFDSGHGGGMFVGGEWGIAPAPPLEVGMTLDWFHHESQNGEVVTLDSRYDLPVQVVTGNGASTDLVPIGGVIRARFPMGDGRVAPFIAGHLTYDILHLDARPDPTNPSALDDTHWFTGFGTGVSGGVEADMAPGFGMLFEAGLHQSDPGANLRVDGVPAEARVRTNGGYLRAGAKFSF